MKRRMYLRGFGLGIIMTALVLSFGIKTENGTMSDAQVRQRALELGMVDESTTLTTELPKADESDEDKATSESLNTSETPEISDATDATDDSNTSETETEKEYLPEETVNKDSDAEIKEEDKTEVVVSSDDNSEKEEKTDNTKEESKNEKTDEIKKEEPKSEEPKSEEPKEEANANTNKQDYTLTVKGGYSSDTVAKILADAGVVDSAASFDKYLCDNGYDNRISVGTYKIPAGSDYATIAKLITHSK